MDIAAVAIAYLADTTGVPWYHDRPKGAPAVCGTLVRSGGPSRVGQDRPTLTLQCYAATRGDACDLAEVTKEALLDMPWGVTNVFHSEILGDYYDPLDDLHRHRITAQLITN